MVLPAKKFPLHIHPKTMGKTGGRERGWIPHPKQRLSFGGYTPRVGRSLTVGVEPGCNQNLGKGVWYALDGPTNMDR